MNPLNNERVDIVMIDDDELTLESARRRLRKSDHVLLPLRDGETLIEVLDAHDVHLLIVDYHLARSNGLELIESLSRRQITLPRTLILATVIKPDSVVVSSAEALGMRVMLKEELINTETLESLAA